MSALPTTTPSATPADAEAIARLFHEDMRHLGVEVSRESLEGVASQVIEGANREDPTCLCWVVRPRPARRVR
jgi:hypothetical protein